MKEFSYWFDSESWFPLGRYVGQTVFPGLMYTTVFFKKLLSFIGLPLDILYICVFCAPFFSIFTCLFGYLITYEISGRIETGLLAALFISVVPSYLSRSVAGSYDNEAISISLLLLVFYFFVKGIKTGNFIHAVLSGLFYSYLVASWGGYSFVIALIPVFVLATLLTKLFNERIYLTYVIFYLIGNLFSMQTKFVEFKVWQKSEHLFSHFVFLLLQLKILYEYLQLKMHSEKFQKLIRQFIVLSIVSVLSGIVYLGFMGKTEFSLRILTLIDPHYAKKFIPIVASVSEHQPNQWCNIFFDFHFLILFQPIGLYFLLKKPTPEKLFVGIYFATSIYFQSLMVRLMLIAFPCLCIVGAIGVSEFIHYLIKSCYSKNESVIDSSPDNQVKELSAEDEHLIDSQNK